MSYMARVLRKFPNARCVPWHMKGPRAYIVVPTNAAFNAYDLGAGTTPTWAWANAAKRLDDASLRHKEK